MGSVGMKDVQSREAGRQLNASTGFIVEKQSCWRGSPAADRLGVDKGGGWRSPGRSLGRKILNDPLTLLR
jgi:hypothetical protein